MHVQSALQAMFVFGVPWQACTEEYVPVQMNPRSGPIVQYSGVAHRCLTTCMRVARLPTAASDR